MIVRAQCISDKKLTIYRIIAKFLCLSSAIVAFAPNPSGFIFYLTNWAYVLTLLYLSYVIVYGLDAFYLHQSSKLHKFLSFFLRERGAQFLFELVWATEVVTTLWFWVAVIVLQLEHKGFDIVYAIVAHTVPFVFVGVDNIFNCIRFRLYDFLLLQLVYVPYGIVNWLCVKLKLGPNPVYPYITWNNWATFLAIFGSELTAFLAFLIGYFIGEYKYKKEKNRLNESESENETGDETDNRNLNVRIKNNLLTN